MGNTHAMIHQCICNGKVMARIQWQWMKPLVHWKTLGGGVSLPFSHHQLVLCIHYLRHTTCTVGTPHISHMATAMLRPPTVSPLLCLHTKSRERAIKPFNTPLSYVGLINTKYSLWFTPNDTRLTAYPLNYKETHRSIATTHNHSPCRTLQRG